MRFIITFILMIIFTPSAYGTVYISHTVKLNETLKFDNTCSMINQGTYKYGDIALQFIVPYDNPFTDITDHVGLDRIPCVINIGGRNYKIDSFDPGTQTLIILDDSNNIRVAQDIYMSGRYKKINKIQGSK